MTHTATGYTPRPGSKAEAAVAALPRTPWMSNVDMAAELEIEPANLTGNLSVPVREGLIRKVARDGVAGYALGGTGDPVEDGEEDPPPKKTSREPLRKDTRAPRARRPRMKRQAKPADEDWRYTGNGTRSKYSAKSPPALEIHVGILKDGKIVVIDGDGHAMILSPQTAKRVAQLVARTK